MIPIEVALAFLGIAVVLALTPGPDNIFVLTQSALQGRTAGIIVTLGLCTGIVIHTTAVALGVAAIFKASDIAFNLLKIAGVIYLLYLAWQAMRASAVTISVQNKKKRNYLPLYSRGFVMNVTNPKVSIFFLAFLPQFTHPSNGAIWLQIIILGLLFIASTMLVFGAIAVVSGSIGEKFTQSDSAQIWMNRIAATVFLGLAIKLALVQQ
jgi:threonine/homoserine/homoserine lactone efflux protein